MANTETGFEARPIDEVKHELLERAKKIAIRFSTQFSKRSCR